MMSICVRCYYFSVKSVASFPKISLVKTEAARKLKIRFPFYVKTPSFRVDLTGTKFSKENFEKVWKNTNLFTGNVIRSETVSSTLLNEASSS